MVSLLSDGKYHEQIRIAEDATGYSYEALFKPYISSLLTEVWVEDPYIRHIHQVRARLCEAQYQHDTRTHSMTQALGWGLLSFLVCWCKAPCVRI